MPEKPIEGEWYWVRRAAAVPENDRWWLAKCDLGSAGGWTNEDTWEDWDGEVVEWIHVPSPTVQGISDKTREQGELTPDTLAEAMEKFVQSMVDPIGDIEIVVHQHLVVWRAQLLRLGRWRNAAKNLMVACGYDPALVAAAEEPEQATLRGA